MIGLVLPPRGCSIVGGQCRMPNMARLGFQSAGCGQGERLTLGRLYEVPYIVGKG